MVPLSEHSGFGVPPQIRLLFLWTVTGIATPGEDGLNVFEKIHWARNGSWQRSKVGRGGAERAGDEQVPDEQHLDCTTG